MFFTFQNKIYINKSRTITDIKYGFLSFLHDHQDTFVYGPSNFRNILAIPIEVYLKPWSLNIKLPKESIDGKSGLYGG